MSPSLHTCEMCGRAFNVQCIHCDGLYEGKIEDIQLRASRPASPPAEPADRCTVCRATFSETGQHTHQPWMAWGPSYRICCWCVQAGRDERRRRERESASPAVRAPREPERKCSHQYWDLGHCIDCFKTQNQIDWEARAALRAPQQEQNDERIRNIGAASSTDTERTSQTLDAVERARAEGHPTE